MIEITRDIVTESVCPHSLEVRQEELLSHGTTIIFSSAKLSGVLDYQVLYERNSAVQRKYMHIPFDYNKWKLHL